MRMLAFSPGVGHVPSKTLPRKLDSSVDDVLVNADKYLLDMKWFKLREKSFYLDHHCQYFLWSSLLCIYSFSLIALPI